MGFELEAVICKKVVLSFLIRGLNWCRFLDSRYPVKERAEFVSPLMVIRTSIWYSSPTLVEQATLRLFLSKAPRLAGSQCPGTVAKIGRATVTLMGRASPLVVRG